jgi:superfamily II DNA or RNA helicase
MQMGGTKPVLVVCPEKMVAEQWMREVQKFTHNIAANLCTHSPVSKSYHLIHFFS